MSHMNTKISIAAKDRLERPLNTKRVELLKALHQQYGYTEMPEVDSARLDVREQLRANLNQLESLHFRLKFMMTEIKEVIRR